MNITNMKVAVKKFNILFLCILGAFYMSGCNNENGENDFNNQEVESQVDENGNENEKVSEMSIEEIVSTYHPDELGDIPVIMYHAVVENPPSVYQRSIEGFKEDLEYMYSHGYRTISNSDYVNYNITTEVGMTPILLTFDDGETGTFALRRDEEGNLVPEENCAIDIMEKFYKEHPDFGKNAILYINGHASTFQGKDTSITLEERIQWLFDHDYEVSNHTNTHLNIKKSSANEIVKNIAIVDKEIKDIKSDANLTSIAYPFGAKPTEENERYILNGTYEGHSYSYQIGFREGPSKPRFYPIIHTDFEALNVPRLRGNKGEVGDMHSYFESYEKNPSLRFISDGNPNRLVVPASKESKINKNVIGDKEVYTYVNDEV